MSAGDETAVDLAEAVERADPDELLRVIDGLCAARSWEAIVELRDRCEHAVERGKQLWGVAAHADYRLALEAPGELAASVVLPGRGRFALGPLPEVAASTHPWADLAPHLPAGPLAAVTAHERVVRGEQLDGDASIDRHVLELPLHLAGWEPEYPVATYHADRVEAPSPRLPPMERLDLEAPAPPVDEIAAVEALADLTKAWTEESNGQTEIAAVSGDAPGAIAALGLHHARIAPISLEQAMAMMAWAAAQGGAHGRRRGAAAGRFAAWWALAALAGVLDDWPLEEAELGEAGRELRFYAWSDLVPPSGWTLHLAAEDPEHGLAWAVAAVDAE